MSEELSQQDLPVPDYDHVPVEALPQHVSGLEAADMVQLITYEKANGNRPPVLLVLEKRFNDLQGGGGARVPRATGIQEASSGTTDTAEAAQVPGRPIYETGRGSNGEPADPGQPGT